jgi:hypothetical protein
LNPRIGTTNAYVNKKGENTLEVKNYLPDLYGSGVEQLVLDEIKTLASESNIPFDKKYISLGISFLVLKAKDIAEGKSKKCSLKALVCESFGEAAMYKYNVNGGVL